MKKTIIRYHTKKDSALFKKESRSRLARLLFISVKRLEFLASDKKLYRSFPQKKSDGSVRHIDAPPLRFERCSNEDLETLNADCASPLSFRPC